MFKIFNKQKTKITKEIILEMCIFTVGLFSIIIFQKNNIFVSFILILLYLIGNRFWHKKHDYIFYIAGALLGTTTEIIAVNSGVWTYVNYTMLNIPLWLPFAWGLAGVLITRTAETFIKIEKL